MLENNVTTEKLIQLLEQQLANAHQQNQELSQKLDQALAQIHQLTKALYGSKSEKSKYQVPDGQGSLFEDDPSLTNLSRQKNKALKRLVIQLLVKRQIKNETIPFVRI